MEVAVDRCRCFTDVLVGFEIRAGGPITVTNLEMGPGLLTRAALHDEDLNMTLTEVTGLQTAASMATLTDAIMGGALENQGRRTDPDDDARAAPAGARYRCV